jgi:hypothetical protein
LPIVVISAVGLIAIGIFAGQGDDSAGDSSPSAEPTRAAGTIVLCLIVDMGPLTDWKDPVTVVELGATGAAGQTMYAWGIDDAVWVASTDNPNETAVILPVNQAARDYDPVTGADVDVFQSAFADAAEEAEGALAACG